MKRIAWVLIIAVVLATSCAYAEQMDIRVLLNGNDVEYDVKPFVENQTVLVPIRKTFESLGMTVNWDDETKTAFAFGNGTAIILKLDSKEAVVMDQKVELLAPPRAVEGRLLVPLRFIAESLGAEVKWEQETKTVRIETTKNKEGQTVDRIELPPLIFE